MAASGLLRKKRPRIKLNEAKTLDLADHGVRPTDIARAQGVHPSTVWRFLEQYRGDRRRIERFKANRADLLAGLQGRCQDVQHRIIDTLDDGIINTLKQGEKTGLLIALNATAGTSFDKERLQRGQSTSNQSIISRMLDDTVRDLYKQPAASKAQAACLEEQADA